MQGLQPVECKAIMEDKDSIVKNWYHDEEIDESLQPFYQLRDIVSAPF